MITIVKNRLLTPTETFVIAHVRNLAQVSALIHGTPPTAVQPEHTRQMTSYTWWRRWLDYPHVHALLTFVIQPWLTRRYSRLFRKHSTSVVLAEFGPSATLVLSACRKMQLPLVMHFHGYDATDKRALKIYGKKYISCFHYAKSIIAVSEAMRATLLALGAPAEKIQVIRYGVDTIRIQHTYNSITKASVFTFVCIARFVEKKGHLYTINAFAEVHKRYPKTQLRFVGNGPLEERCKQLVQQLGLENHIHFLGAASHDKVLEEICAAHALVLHSITAQSGDKEGTPVSIVEGIIAGLPIVSTNHSGIPEIVRHGETGYVVQEKDSTAMAEAMSRLVQDPQAAAQMGQNGKETFGEELSQTHSLGILEHILQQATI